MSNRTELIKKIEVKRGTRVIAYVTSSKPNLRVHISPMHVRQIKRHLDSIPKGSAIDLFLYSLGGDSSTPWPLINLLRERAGKLSVLIPFRAFSAATSISIGADEIVMAEMGTLGPIDPTVTNLFNPVINGQQVGISVEDVSHFAKLARNVFKINSSEGKSGVMERLAQDVKPLALGNAYRHYVKARADAKELLSLHMKPWEMFKRDRIVKTLVEELYYHGHHINRGEAERIGLKVVRPDDELEGMMWSLFEKFEADMGMEVPYADAVTPATGRLIPVTYIESSGRCDTINLKQVITPMNFPVDAKLTIADGKPAVLVQAAGGINQLFPLATQGTPTIINGAICDKVEQEEVAVEMVTPAPR